MPYATLQDLKDRYGEPFLVTLTDRGEIATGEVDQASVDRALADTDQMIDGYLAARYRLPLSPVPGLVRDVAQAIAIWKLHVFDANEKITADYKDAQRTLRDIAQGTVRLQAEGVAATGSGDGDARVTDRSRPFTEKSLKGFI